VTALSPEHRAGSEISLPIEPVRLTAQDRSRSATGEPPQSEIARARRNHIPDQTTAPAKPSSQPVEKLAQGDVVFSGLRIVVIAPRNRHELLGFVRCVEQLLAHREGDQPVACAVALQQQPVIAPDLRQRVERDQKALSVTAARPRYVMSRERTTRLMFSFTMCAEPSQNAKPQLPGWKL
jgi:hypothetical protein